MFIFNLFEKPTKSTSTSDVEKSDLYQNTKDQRVRNMLRTAHKENPGAHSDLEALAGHMADVDATNKRQDAEEKQLRKTQDQMIKDLQDKERRFRAFTAKVAAMDLSPQQSAKAAQDIEKDIEPDLEKYRDQDQEIKAKAKDAEQPQSKEKKAEPAFNPTTGTPTGNYKPKKDKPELRVVRHQAKNKEQPAPSVDDVPIGPAQNVSAPIPTAAPAVDTPAPVNPKHQQLSNLGMRFGNAANIPRFRQTAESVLAEALSQAESEQIYNHNSQAFAKSYAESQATKLYYGNGQWEDLTAAEVEQLVSAIATDYTEQARPQVWEQLFTDHNYFNEFKKQHLSQMPLFTTEELVGGNFGPAANDPQHNGIKTRALEIIKAAYDPGVPDSVIQQQKDLFRQDYPGWSFSTTADKKIAVLVNHQTNVRLPIIRLTDLSEDSWHAGDNAWSSDKNNWTESVEESRLSVGDPVVVTAPNEFEGKTGEIAEFSPSGKFVIVNLYNHGEHSMHLLDVEYNQYADNEVDEGWYNPKSFPGTKIGANLTGQQPRVPIPQIKDQIIKSLMTNHKDIIVQYGPRDVNIVAQSEAAKADTSPQGITKAVNNVVNFLTSGLSVNRLRQQTLEDGVDETIEGQSDVATPHAIYIDNQLWKVYADAKTALAMEKKVKDSLKAHGRNQQVVVKPYYKEVAEGFQDFNKVEPYAVCLAGKPVKTFDYYEDARRFHDNWKKKLYREGNKAKADKITLMPLNLDEAVDQAKALKAAQQAAKFMIRNLDDRAALKDYSMHFWSPERFYQGATMAIRGVGYDEIVKHITQDEPAWFPKPQYEAANPAQQAAIAIAMKKAGKKPKSVDEVVAAPPPEAPPAIIAPAPAAKYMAKKPQAPQAQQADEPAPGHPKINRYDDDDSTLKVYKPEQYREDAVNELDVNTLKSYADKRGAQVAAMKADNPTPTPGSPEWVKQAVPAQQVNLAKRKIARKERQAGVAESTNYWKRLQDERNVKLNSLVNELKESIK